MKEKLFQINLPHKYKPNLFKYEIGIDNVPDWLTLQRAGWTFKEYLKLEKIVEIECMKYILGDAINENKIEQEEIEECKKMIQESIEKYNEM